MKRTEEIELKLLLSPADAARLESLPQLGIAREASEQVSTYYDTPEGHLRKAGFSLRVRQRRGRYVQTLKNGGGGAGGFSARGEWERRIGEPDLDLDALSDTPLSALLSRKKVKGRLEMASRTRVRRTTWQIDRDSSRIEVILDLGEIVVGDRRDPVCEIELELKSGSPRALFDLAREIGAEIPLRLGVASKSERGAALALRRPRRTFKAEGIDLLPGATIADAFATILRSCLRHFRRNEAAASGAAKVEAVHQLRVAVRRLRSAFSLFRPVIAGREANRFREALKNLSSLLGKARDLDVALDLLRRSGGPTGEMRDARRQAYDALAAGLASDVPRLFLDLAAWVEVGPWRDVSRAQRAVDRFAVERLDRQWRKLRKAATVAATSDAMARHRLRVEVKKLRYAAQFFVGLGQGGRRRRTLFLVEVKRLQEGLGTLNDIGMAIDAGAEPAALGDQAALLREVRSSYDRLRAIGPYWR